MQIVFQDPYASLNPRMTVGAILAEPIALHGLAERRGARRPGAGAAARVGLAPVPRRPLPARVLRRAAPAHRHRPRPRDRAPTSSSATSRSRRSTCRSRPRWSTCCRTCRPQLGLSYLFIAHDLAVVKHIADRVAVMYLGRIVELADKHVLYAPRATPTRQALLSAAPRPDPTARAQRYRAPGRRAEPLKPTARLHLSHPLPLRPGALPRRGAGVAAAPRRADGRVPLRRRDRAAHAAGGAGRQPACCSAAGRTGAGARGFHARRVTPATAARLYQPLEHLRAPWHPIFDAAERSSRQARLPPPRSAMGRYC